MVIERDLRMRVALDAQRVAEQALAEDGADDVTTGVCAAPNQTATGVLESRSDEVLAGMPYADAVAEAVGLAPITWYHAAGSLVNAGTTIGLVQGDAARVLRAERPVLNLLQRAVGIATITRAFVDAVAGTRARILHTRKTAPGLRLLDVTAVLAGGGHAHRLDLSSVVMVKDNHWRVLAQSGRRLAGALELARSQGVSHCYVEVEALEQVAEAIAAGATRLLIDNQTAATVRGWAEAARKRQPAIEIEATGGITLGNVRIFAEAGVDYISIGALTHSVKAGDVSLELRAEK